jgi:hypothetical protein
LLLAKPELFPAGPNQLALATTIASAEFKAFALKLAGNAIDYRNDVFQPHFAGAGVN